MGRLPAAEEVLSLERFVAKIDKATQPECWLWISAHRGGTPYFFMHGRAWNVRTILANPGPAQWAIPSCNEKLCVSPQHLTLLDRTGLRERFRSNPTLFGPGSAQALRTHCPQGHAYTGANVYKPPSRPNERRCKACSSERARDLRDRRRGGRGLQSLYPQRRSPHIAAQMFGCTVEDLVDAMPHLVSQDAEIFSRYWGLGRSAPQSCKVISEEMRGFTAGWASTKRIEIERLVRQLLDLKEERRA